VREVHDAHEAEDQRKSGRKNEEERPEGKAVQTLNDPEIHSGISRRYGE
jgi:hypothetical protein